MIYAAAGLGFVGVLLFLCGALLVLVTNGEDRKFSQRIAGWGVLCLMGSGLCWMLSSTGL